MTNHITSATWDPWWQWSPGLGAAPPSSCGAEYRRPKCPFPPRHAFYDSAAPLGSLPRTAGSEKGGKEKEEMRRRRSIGGKKKGKRQWRRKGGRGGKQRKDEAELKKRRMTQKRKVGKR